MIEAEQGTRHLVTKSGRNKHDLENDLLAEHNNLEVFKLLQPGEDLLHRLGLRLFRHGAHPHHHLLASIFAAGHFCVQAHTIVVQTRILALKSTQGRNVKQVYLRICQVLKIKSCFYYN